jgi:hypothetical protein
MLLGQKWSSRRHENALNYISAAYMLYIARCLNFLEIFLIKLGLLIPKFNFLEIVYQLINFKKKDLQIDSSAKVLFVNLSTNSW